MSSLSFLFFGHKVKLVHLGLISKTPVDEHWYMQIHVAVQIDKYKRAKVDNDHIRC